MAKIDRLHFLTSLFNLDVLNEIDKANGYNTYHPFLGVRSKLVPVILRSNTSLLKIYIAIIVFFYPFVGLAFTIRAIFDIIWNKKNNLHGGRTFLFASIALPRVAKNTGLTIREDDVWLLLPWMNYTNKECINLRSSFSLLSFIDAIRAYWDSIVVVYYVYRKKGCKFVLPTLLSIRWFLYNLAIRKLPYNTELFFANHKDLYAVLFKYLPHSRKCLIQHGTEIVLENPAHVGSDLYEYNQQFNFWSNKLPVRYNDIAVLYCFTEKERVAMSTSVLNCSPEVNYVGYSLKQFNENIDGKKAILIVGYSTLYIERETELIKRFQGTGIRVYLKNHPTLQVSAYKEIQNSLDFVLLNGPIFPKVDVVFSYSSTLALEYDALGVEVILYDGLPDMVLYETIDSVIKRINKENH